MENRDSAFRYTYSASEQAEVENIRKKYLPREENKMEQLRKLHNSATQKAQAWAIGLGVMGALLLGVGMSLFLSELGVLLGLDPHLAMGLGVAVGVIGLVLVALAYPAFNRILKKEREKIAPQILRLTEELMK